MIRELRTLLAVAREGTFAAAGDRIGLTQAAVSAQMQRLESELGGALFDRTGRTARLNALGRQTLARAQEIVRLYDGLGQRAATGAQAAPVSVGAIASVERSMLPEVLARFHKRHAGYIRVVPGVSLRLLELVDAGDIDMAVIIRPPFTLPRDLHWTALTHEPFRLLVPKAVRGNDWAAILASQPFIRYDRGSFGGRLVERFLRNARVTPNEICELDELDAMVGLVARGVGVALVPQTASHRRWPAGVRAVDLGRDTFHRDLGLVHRSTHALSEPAQALAALIAVSFAP